MYVGTHEITGAHHDGHDGKALFFRGSRIWAKTCFITQTLDGVTSDAPNTVTWGDGLVVSFTPESGKVLLPSTVRVTMGGVDVTDTAYKLATNTVEIPAVTGDVTITAGAVSVDSAYKPLLYVATREVIAGNMITLPYKANSNTKLVMDVSIEEKSNSVLYSGKGSIASSSASSPNYAFAVRTEKTSKWWLIHGATGSGNVGLTVGKMMCGQRTTFVNNKGVVSYKNQSGDVYNRTYNGGEWSLNSNLNIMANGHNSYISDGKLYNVEISEPTDDDANILLDYIPIMRLSDGKVGIYDLVNGDAIVNNNYIAPYNTLASGLTNCSASLLSGTDTGTTTRAAIGSTWSIKLTPTAASNATFNSNGASMSLKIGGVDVTNAANPGGTPYVAYDSTTDTYTITIENVPQENIELAATAYSEGSVISN